MSRYSILFIILLLFPTGLAESYTYLGVYPPGQAVIINISKPTEQVVVVDPINRTAKLNVHENLVKIYLNKDVILGNYLVYVGSNTFSFDVDLCEIEAKVKGTTVQGKVKCYSTIPSHILYICGNKTQLLKIKKGKFKIKNVTCSKITLQYGKFKKEIEIHKKNLTINLKRDVYFPGEKVEIEVNFKPKRAFILTPTGKLHPLTFKDNKAILLLNRGIVLGKYTIVADEEERSFYVDFYNISASYKGKFINGSVGYYFKSPEKIGYIIRKTGKVVHKGYVEVVNDTFYIPLNLTPGNYTAFLKCGNAALKLNFTVYPAITKIYAYDPVEKQIIVKVYGDTTEKFNFSKLGIFQIAVRKKIIHGIRMLEYHIPATVENLRKLQLPESLINTTITIKRISREKIRVELNNKQEVWYRFKVKIPTGYRVKEIKGDDGRLIVNNLSINRLTGEVEGEIRWYVENSTLYFYDDPIWGYNITLIPPAPSNSIAIELAYSGTYAGSGQISAIVFPYSQGDNATTISTHDHAGRTEDNGYGNDIDYNAGSKIALRFGTLQYGNWYCRPIWWFCLPRTLGANGNIPELNRTDVPLNTVPDGTLESVIITDMQTAGGEANITQKVIIRDNYRWFATVYYIKPNTALTNLRFFQGMDWNFRGSYTGDNAYYNSTYDIVYGYDTNAPAGDIQYGGYSSDLGSSAHDVNYYTTIWGNIRSNNLLNGTTYIGDAATALAWDRPSLNVGETWVVPVIWGLGYNFTDMVEQINAGKARLYDTGVNSIDYPGNNSKFDPNVVQIVNFNATVALYGLVDAENLRVIFNVTRIGGGYSYQNYTYVNLSVPFTETAVVSFPLNLSGLPYGDYNVSFKTTLNNDQNTTNDIKWIIIHLIAFSVEPNQEKTGNAGDEVFYNLTASNHYSAGRFDVNITQSTKGWATRLYNGSTLIAEDTDGDSKWDYIAPGYDANSNNLPDLFIPLGKTNITVSKLIPASTPLGEVDYTTLTFISISNPSVNDDVRLTTKTPLPPSQPKTFHLHGDLTMNTSSDTSAASFTSIAPNSLVSWYQSPRFADDFTLSGKVDIYLWLNSSSAVAQHTVTVTLLYTDGVISTVLGTNSSRLVPGSTPSLHLFEITLDSIKTIPRNSYLVLRVENSQTSQTLYLHQDAAHNSNITLNTTTYVKVVNITTLNSRYKPGTTAVILANVTDPIGSYDIAGANITVYYPNNTLYLKGMMNLNSTDSGTPSLWKTFNYSFYLPVEGVYNVVVTGIESNGVVANLSTRVTAFVDISGRVFEDFGSLGSAFSAGEDTGISGVRVAIFRDDGDGIFDASRDLPYAVTITNASGGYNFSIGRGLYFIAVDSKSVNTTHGINPGYSIEDIWAEQTFGVSWNGSTHAGGEKFGGRNASVSDNFGLIFFDDFESFSGWTNYSSGIIQQSSDISYRGSFSLKKTAYNDPNGGYKLIGRRIGRGIVLEGYTYRPASFAGGPIDRVGIENGSFDGYSFRVHHTQNYISIDRRTGGAATEISTRVAWDPPENEWYYWRLFIYANGTITFATYYANGSIGASVSTTDLNYSDFDRIVIHGGYDYYVDNIYLRRINASYEHVVKLNATAYGGESIDFGFSFEVVVNTRDGDDDLSSKRTVQGSLRQFIINANAISGMQRSVFRIPYYDGGYTTETLGLSSVDVWRINLSSPLPQIKDSVFINASTQPGTKGTIPGKKVGVDEYTIPDFTTPRVEVYGNWDIIVVNSTSAIVEGLSINTNGYYTSGVKAVGNHTHVDVRDCFFGLLANGSPGYTGHFGITLGEYYETGLHAVNLTMKAEHVIVSNSKFYGIVVNNGNRANLTLEDSWIYGNGGANAISDGISFQTDGNTILHCLIENNTNNGSTYRKDGGAGVELVVWSNPTYTPSRILNSTIRGNFQWGISLLSTYTRAIINYSIIEGNGAGVLVSDTSRGWFLRNSIFNNTWLGIDLAPQWNVTPNDGLLNCSQPNCGVDYPVITKAELSGDTLYVEGFIGNESTGGSPAFAGAEVELYLVKNSTAGDNLEGNNYTDNTPLADSYGEGYLYLGSLTANASGYFSGAINVSGKGVEAGALITSTATLSNYGTSEFGRNTKVVLYRNVSAEIELIPAGDCVNLTLTVRAFNKPQRNVMLFWDQPAWSTITGMSGSYASHAVNGSLHRWVFPTVIPGSPEQVLLSLSCSGDFQIKQVYQVGVDPE